MFCRLPLHYVGFSMDTKLAIGRRHRQVREQILQMSVAEYAQAVGVKDVTVYSWEAGRTSVPQHVLIWLEQQHHVSVSWMLTGTGHTPLQPQSTVSDPSTGTAPYLEHLQQHVEELRSMIHTLRASSPDVVASARTVQSRPRIPLLSLAVSAGLPTASDDTIEREIDLAEMLLEHPDSTYFIRVVGDSMTDAGISDGDTLIVDCALHPKSGQIVIAKVFGELTVKRYLTIDGRPLLRAENKRYKDIPITEEMDFTIVGVVTSCIKRY